MIRLSRRFLHLLTQEIKAGDFLRARFVSININIVADSACRPQSMNAARDQQVLRENVIKKCLCIIEQFARLFANFGVVENRRITTTQFPRMKERRPIDEFDEIPERDRDFLGSTRVSRAGCAVAPKRTFLHVLSLVRSGTDGKSSRSRDALASTRDGRATQIARVQAHTEELRFRRDIAAPIDWSAVRARFIEGQQLFFSGLCSVL